ncbi:MAG: hypothetical protein IJ334_11985, partial [Clostridia bacterium]|nr:hypothetical protein [Clostridia bacterium]
MRNSETGFRDHGFIIPDRGEKYNGAADGFLQPMVGSVGGSGSERASKALQFSQFYGIIMTEIRQYMGDLWQKLFLTRHSSAES